MFFSTALIFLLIVLNILVYYLQIQQEEEDDDEQKYSSPPFAHEENHDESKDSSSLDKQCRVFSLSELKSATRNFDDEFVIGKGGFEKVYKGKIDQEIEVAIKRLNLESNQGATEFWAEIEMLSKFRHSHIVSLFGYCQESGQREMILVYEYMPNGSLDDHLHKRKTNCSPLTWVERLHICIGAARGLDYLHTGTGVQSRVIHRDIKSSNILLDENWAAKISDFGVSRIGPAYQSGSTTNVFTQQIIGTFGYLDAEYYLTHRLTRKTDVYAFGVVLLEVLCGRPALDFSLDEEQHSLAIWAIECIKEGKGNRIIDPCLRGQVEGKCLKEFGQIAYECVFNSSKNRPTMTKVLARLEFVLARTLRNHQSAGDRRRTTFIDKAWSLLSTKAPKNGMSPDAMKLEQNVGDNKEGIMMGKHVTTIVEGGCHSGDNVEQTIFSLMKRFTFAELKYATKNFCQVIGEGGFGKVYKGCLGNDGLAVAIKMLYAESMQGLAELQAEVTFLGKLSHPNLINLLGYCQSDNELLLVYEYMENGSLEDHLFKNGANPLSWHTRIKIAIGSAQALDFLHTTENNVICRDMKPSNILLDRVFTYPTFAHSSYIGF